MLDAGLMPSPLPSFVSAGVSDGEGVPPRAPDPLSTAVSDAIPAPTAEAVGQIVVRVLPRLTRHLVAKMHEAPQAQGLTWPQFRVLGYLSERDYRASELADALEIGRSTLTTIGDGLVRRGLIERLRDLPDDRRGVLMRLTAEGHSLHALLKAHAVEGVASLLSSAGEGERTGLVAGLEAIERGLCAALLASTMEAP